jgi:hypothetical protein
MIIAALYFIVLIGAAILLGILWLAYKGLAYIWYHWFQTGEQIGHDEVNETTTK